MPTRKQLEAQYPRVPAAEIKKVRNEQNKAFHQQLADNGDKLEHERQVKELVHEITKIHDAGVKKLKDAGIYGKKKMDDL